MALYSVRNLLILDADGQRVLCKYYSQDISNIQSQKQYEKNLFGKTHKTPDGEVIFFENLVSVYRAHSDLLFYMSGGSDENEIMLMSCLSTLVEALSTLLRGQLEKRIVLENYELLLLAIDELIDGGIILENESAALVQKVTMRSENDPASSDQTLSQAFQTAKEQFARTLRQG
eukprot:TRINITY_DN967_c0_g1_i1.p1 TRINITY_DN967_c0_g1~~TRINITY_DN967_c0_g1_i1.p1  ORF type:complete len:174 (-),score=49.56 TRINITY_DN967_c0_g1_i1:269-790(-)